MGSRGSELPQKRAHGSQAAFTEVRAPDVEVAAPLSWGHPSQHSWHAEFSRGHQDTPERLGAEEGWAPCEHQV